MIHKDVKPANVLIWTDRGGAPHVRLTDFGIGHALDRGRIEAAGALSRYEACESRSGRTSAPQ